MALLAGVQAALSGLNVLLLAPVWLQLVRLPGRRLLWIAVVLLGAAALAGRAPAATWYPRSGRKMAARRRASAGRARLGAVVHAVVQHGRSTEPRGAMNTFSPPFFSVHMRQLQIGDRHQGGPRLAIFSSNTASVCASDCHASGVSTARPAATDRKRLAQGRDAPRRDGRQMHGELAERHRPGVRSPAGLGLGDALDHSARHRGLVVELGEQRLGNRHHPVG